MLAIAGWIRKADAWPASAGCCARPVFAGARHPVHVELAGAVRAREEVVVIHGWHAWIGLMIGHTVLVRQVVDDGGVGAHRPRIEQSGFVHGHYAREPVVPRTFADAIDSVDRATFGPSATLRNARQPLAAAPGIDAQRAHCKSCPHRRAHRLRRSAGHRQSRLGSSTSAAGREARDEEAELLERRDVAPHARTGLAAAAPACPVPPAPAALAGGAAARPACTLALPPLQLQPPRRRQRQRLRLRAQPAYRRPRRSRRSQQQACLFSRTCAGHRNVAGRARGARWCRASALGRVARAACAEKHQASDIQANRVANLFGNTLDDLRVPFSASALASRVTGLRAGDAGRFKRAATPRCETPFRAPDCH